MTNPGTIFLIARRVVSFCHTLCPAYTPKIDVKENPKRLISKVFSGIITFAACFNFRRFWNTMTATPFVLCTIWQQNLRRAVVHCKQYIKNYKTIPVAISRGLKVGLKYTTNGTGHPLCTARFSTSCWLKCFARFESKNI